MGNSLLTDLKAFNYMLVFCLFANPIILDCVKNLEITTINWHHNKTWIISSGKAVTRIYNLILSLYGLFLLTAWLDRERSLLMIGWVWLSWLYSNTYLIAMEMVLSKAPIEGALPCRNQIRYVCLVASLQIRRLNKERTMKEIEQVWDKMAHWRNISCRPWQHSTLTHVCTHIHTPYTHCTLLFRLQHLRSLIQ